MDWLDIVVTVNVVIDNILEFISVNYIVNSNIVFLKEKCSNY